MPEKAGGGVVAPDDLLIEMDGAGQESLWLRHAATSTPGIPEGSYASMTRSVDGAHKLVGAANSGVMHSPWTRTMRPTCGVSSPARTPTGTSKNPPMPETHGLQQPLDEVAEYLAAADIQFTSPSFGWLAVRTSSNAVRTYRTTDGGSSWSKCFGFRQTRPWGKSPHVGSQDCWYVVNGTQWRTSDGGARTGISRAMPRPRRAVSHEHGRLGHQG